MRQYRVRAVTITGGTVSPSLWSIDNWWGGKCLTPICSTLSAPVCLQFVSCLIRVASGQWKQDFCRFHHWVNTVPLGEPKWSAPHIKKLSKQSWWELHLSRLWLNCDLNVSLLAVCNWDILNEKTKSQTISHLISHDHTPTLLAPNK